MNDLDPEIQKIKKMIDKIRTNILRLHPTVTNRKKDIAFSLNRMLERDLNELKRQKTLK